MRKLRGESSGVPANETEIQRTDVTSVRDIGHAFATQREKKIVTRRNEVFNEGDGVDRGVHRKGAEKTKESIVCIEPFRLGLTASSGGWATTSRARGPRKSGAPEGGAIRTTMARPTAGHTDSTEAQFDRTARDFR